MLTETGKEFHDQNGGDALYILCTPPDNLFWNNDRLEWVRQKSEATRIPRLTLERVGNIAKRHSIHGDAMVIQFAGRGLLAA